MVYIGGAGTILNFEENLIYTPQASQTEHWFWYLLTSPHTESIEINLNGIAAGSGEINVRVAGYSDTPQAPDHHLFIRLNGQIVAEGQWDGKNEYELSGIIPDDVLIDGKNEILIESPGDTGANVDMVMMDTIQISYPIPLNTQSDHLLFEGNNHRLGLTGFSGEVFILDITDSESPTVTGPYLPNEGEIQFQSLRVIRTWLSAQEVTKSQVRCSLIGNPMKISTLNLVSCSPQTRRTTSRPRSNLRLFVP